MARQRTGVKRINQQEFLAPFLSWSILFLQTIGRLTYQSFFFLIHLLLSVPRLAPRLFQSTGRVAKLLFLQLLKLAESVAKSLKNATLPKYAFVLRTKKIILDRKIYLPKLSLKTNFTIIASFLTGLLLITLIAFFYYSILKDLPSPEKLITRKQILSTKIYDRNANLLYTVFDGNHKRSLVKLSEIPDFVKQATIATEDHSFYSHPGFSPKAIARAAWKNMFSDSLQGGSTITQQLVKNAFLSSERTWRRKVKEIILSVQVELVFSKDEILQMYFNEVPYGGTAYGIEEAAQTYLGKSIKDVNLAEAALLAGLPTAPTRYSPFGSNPKLALVRQRQVLQQMITQNYITKEQEQKALNTKIVLSPQTTNISAPHFVMYVKDLLVERYGQRMVEQGGLRVITSLDSQIQEFAQTTVASEVAKLNPLHVSNGAALITKPSTGEILAMIGSKDFFDKSIDGNVNVTIRPRQPGSSIKVITYSAALSNGFTPTTTLSDTPITYQIPGSEPYTPANYDQQFHQTVTLKTALASSYNVPAVKTLVSLGINNVVSQAKKMGITTWDDPSRYGLSLTLGSLEVKMTDMAVVYGTLANLGKRVDLKPILRVIDYQGNIIEQLSDLEPVQAEQVLKPAVAYLLTNILADNQARSPAFGLSSYLFIPNHEVAVKTGTTNDKRDNWTIGYTTDFLVAVWVGNNDNTPMSAVASGITGASPIWNKITLKLLENQTSHRFPVPSDIAQVAVCSLNGLLPCDGCPTKVEYFLSGSEPKYHCDSKLFKEQEEKNKLQAHDQILNGIAVTR